MLEQRGEILYLADIRKRGNLSAEKVASHLGISPRRLTQYEKNPGVAPIHIIVSLLRYYKLPDDFRYVKKL